MRHLLKRKQELGGRITIGSSKGLVSPGGQLISIVKGRLYVHKHPEGSKDALCSLMVFISHRLYAVKYDVQVRKVVTTYIFICKITQSWTSCVG